jgi:hypothetical protein
VFREYTQLVNCHHSPRTTKQGTSSPQEELMIEPVIKGCMDNLKVDEEEREFQAEQTV